MKLYPRQLTWSVLYPLPFALALACGGTTIRIRNETPPAAPPRGYGRVRVVAAAPFRRPATAHHHRSGDPEGLGHPVNSSPQTDIGSG